MDYLSPSPVTPEPTHVGHLDVNYLVQGPEGKFMYCNYEGKKLVTKEPDEESEGEASPSSRSSASSEELRPDVTSASCPR
jgi:hypothetical protein